MYHIFIDTNIVYTNIHCSIVYLENKNLLSKKYKKVYIYRARERERVYKLNLTICLFYNIKALFIIKI